MAITLENTKDIIYIPVSSTYSIEHLDLVDDKSQKNLEIAKTDTHQNIETFVLKHDYFKTGLVCISVAVVVYGCWQAYGLYVELVNSTYLNQIEQVAKLGSKHIEFYKNIKDATSFNKRFDAVYINLKDFTQSALGTAIAVTAILMGGVIGVTKGTPMPAIAGILFSCTIHYAPLVIEDRFNIKKTSSTEDTNLVYEKSTDTIEKAVSKLNKELVAKKGLKLVLQEHYPGKTVSSASITDVSNYIKSKAELVALKNNSVYATTKAEAIKARFGSSLSVVCGTVLGIGLIVPLITSRRKLKKIKSSQ